MPGCSPRGAHPRHPDRCCTCGRYSLTGSCTDPRLPHRTAQGTPGQSTSRPRTRRRVGPSCPPDSGRRRLPDWFAGTFCSRRRVRRVLWSPHDIASGTASRGCGTAVEDYYCRYSQQRLFYSSTRLLSGTACRLRSYYSWGLLFNTASRG